MVDNARRARALDRMAAEHAVALELLPAHRFVLEVVQELERVHRLADLAQRREARLRVGQQSQPTSRAGIVIAKLNLQCCCIGHHGHRVRFCGWGPAAKRGAEVYFTSTLLVV